MEVSISSRDFWETFPLLTVKERIIVSKRGDLTVGWKVSLQSGYTIDRDSYISINRRFEAAIRALPPWMLVQRQDMFLKRRYEREESDGFLSERYERHFDSREYLEHQQRIYLTLSCRASAVRPTGSCGVYGFTNVVGEVLKKDVENLRRAASTFEHMLSSADIIRMERMEDEELVSEIERYMNLGDEGVIPTDRKTTPAEVECDGKVIWTFSLTEAKDMGPSITSTSKVESLSSPGAEMHLCSAAPLGVLLGCEHIVNSYILTLPQNEIAKELDKSRGNKVSMSKRSLENSCNAQELEEYSKDTHERQTVTVKAHNNIIIWAEPERMDDICGMTASALSSMGITCKRNTLDNTVVWYSSVPGAGTELGRQCFRTAELASCLCLGINETFQRSIPGGIIKLCDRMRNIPLKVDFQKAAEEAGLISNYNAFILGPSGSGKSFFTNHLTRCLYDKGQTIAIIDMGDSYEGLCNIIREESNGSDGIYMKWNPEKPISFDAFHGFDSWLKDTSEGGEDDRRILQRDHEGVLYLTAIIKYMWTPSKGWLPENESILGDIIEEFARRHKGDRPIFGDLYSFIIDSLVPLQEEQGLIRFDKTSISREKFDLGDMAQAMKNYTPGQTFGFLYNDRNPKDIFTSRFTVFEIADLSQKGEKSYYPLVILGMISAFNSIMRREDGKRKVLIIEEAWKAIANNEMSGFIQELWKTSRKYNTSAVVVSQQFSDLLASESVKDTIIQNSGTKILLSQESNMSEIGNVVSYFGLSPHEKAMLMSLGMNQNPRYRYKEAFVSIGGKHSGVYATELSRQEGLAYQTNKETKRPYLTKAQEAGYRTAADILAKEDEDAGKD